MYYKRKLFILVTGIFGNSLVGGAGGFCSFKKTGIPGGLESNPDHSPSGVFPIRRNPTCRNPIHRKNHTPYLQLHF